MLGASHRMKPYLLAACSAHENYAVNDQANPNPFQFDVQLLGVEQSTDMILTSRDVQPAMTNPYYDVDVIPSEKINRRVGQRIYWIVRLSIY